MTRAKSIALGALLLLGAGISDAAAAPGRLLVRTEFDYSGGRPIEGSLTFMRLRNSKGRLVLARQTRRLDRRLRPGRYTLSTYQRPCNGNCGYLDPPTLRCRRRIRIRPERVLRLLVTVNFTAGCRIERVR